MRTAALLLLLAISASARDLTVRDHNQTVVVSTESSRATVIIFVSAVCPISTSYIDRLNELYQSWHSRDVRFAFVDPNINEQQAQIDEYAKANKLAFPVYTDPGGHLATELKAQMTPEVFVFDTAGTLRYHGRIDDAVNPARVRAHDLRDVLDAMTSGKMDPVLRETRAFGCTIKRKRT